MTETRSVPLAFLHPCGFRHHGDLKTLNPVHRHERFSMFSTPKPPPHQRHLSLSPGELLTLTPTQPTSLHLKSGALWVTQTGDDRDHFLRAGQTMQLAPGRLTVFQAEHGGAQASLAPGVGKGSKLQPWKRLPKLWPAGLQFSA